jgi:hypothetical protein
VAASVGQPRLVAGWLAGQFMRGGGYGIVGDIVLLPERLVAMRGDVAQLSRPAVRGALLGLLDQVSTAVQVPATPRQEDLVAVGAVAARTVARRSSRAPRAAAR